jgi:hypothetical protein
VGGGVTRRGLRRGSLRLGSLGGGEGDADEVVAGDEGGEAVLAPAFGAGGALGEDHPAEVGGAVHDADLHRGGEDRAELGQHRARFADGARPVGGAFVQCGG